MSNSIHVHEVDKLKSIICNAMRYLYLKGFITPLAGNISYRVSDECILVTPSARIKYLLREDDIAVVTIDGKHVEGPKPTSELYMHLEIYRCLRDIRAVVHIHGVVAPIASSLLKCRPFIDTELEYVLKPRICCLPKLPPGSLELAKAVRNAVETGCQVVVLENHGIVAVGRSLEEALELAESVEVAFTRALLLKMMNAIS